MFWKLLKHSWWWWGSNTTTVKAIHCFTLAAINRKPVPAFTTRQAAQRGVINQWVSGNGVIPESFILNSEYRRLSWTVNIKRVSSFWVPSNLEGVYPPKPPVMATRSWQLLISPWITADEVRKAQGRFWERCWRCSKDHRLARWCFRIHFFISPGFFGEMIQFDLRICLTPPPSWGCKNSTLLWKKKGLQQEW